MASTVKPAATNTGADDSPARVAWVARVTTTTNSTAEAIAAEPGRVRSGVWATAMPAAVAIRIVHDDVERKSLAGRSLARAAAAWPTTRPAPSQAT